MFHLKPVGRHVVSVCRNISCDLRGADEIVRRACDVTGARVGESSGDGRFYVETVECQGACADAPMMVVDGEYHENLASDDVDKILGGLE
jgi:NADH-quinone oxidoreductase subunit E